MSYKLNKPYDENTKIDFIVEYNHKHGLRIEETDNALYALEDNEIMQNGLPAEDKEYKEKQAILERQKLDLLTLTPADVERALYKSKGMDFEDLKTLIAEKLPDIDTKALSIEFRAKDFYRGAEVNGTRLFDMAGQLLGYTSEDIDTLFKNKVLPLKK